MKFTWKGCWPGTYLNLDKSQLAHPDCSHLFSDALHRPWSCAHISLTPYSSGIPPNNEIARFPNLTLSEFKDQWYNKPFILTEPVKEWPLYKQWSIDDILKNYGKTVFRAEAVDWPLETYISYTRNNDDESPLYLFDRDFIKKLGLIAPPPPGTDPKSMPDQLPSFWSPPCFGEDLFTVLGDKRPDHQWLILGPIRSGSTFHKDPNATSAWNAVLCGSKYWIMFPQKSSDETPPGVIVSGDQSEVTTPLSVAEWLLAFHAEARRTPGCLEGICGEGEILHVPSGWWHLVVNLDATVAVTQNFVPEKHLPAVLHFLKYKADQISGFQNEIANKVFSLFTERLQVFDHELLEHGLRNMQAFHGEKHGHTVGKRKWDEIVHDPDAIGEGGGFSFGFDDGSDVEVP